MMNLLFCIPTLNPSLDSILTSTIFGVISNLPPSKSIVIVSSFKIKSISSSVKSFKAFWYSFIFGPNMAPQTLKFGFIVKFIYLERSFTNTTFLTFNSSFIKFTKSPKIDSYFPSTKHSLIGWRTLILFSSLTYLPVDIKSLTKSILTSISSLTRPSSYLGKSCKWTDSSFVKFLNNSSVVYGIIGAHNLHSPHSTS